MTIPGCCCFMVAQIYILPEHNHNLLYIFVVRISIVLCYLLIWLLCFPMSHTCTRARKKLNFSPILLDVINFVSLVHFRFFSSSSVQFAFFMYTPILLCLSRYCLIFRLLHNIFFPAFIYIPKINFCRRLAVFFSCPFYFKNYYRSGYCYKLLFLFFLNQHENV